MTAPDASLDLTRSLGTTMEVRARRDLRLWTETLFPALRALIKVGYFRLSVEGTEHVPRTGPVIYVPNHSGWFTLDTLMGALVLADHFGMNRLPWAAVQDELLATPKIGDFFERIGGFPASWLKQPEAIPPEIEALCIYPEGASGNCKSFVHAYQMRSWRSSFVRVAAARGAAIVPLAIVGAEESLPSLATVRFLKPIVGSVLPVPLTLLPLPSNWRLIFHQPVHVSKSELVLENGDSERERTRVRGIAERIRESVQRTLDRETSDRAPVRFLKLLRHPLG